VSPSQSIDPVTADQLTASILARRSGKPGAVQFEQVTDGNGNTAHVVSGELLIRSSDLPAYGAMFAGSTIEAYLDGQLTRVTLPADKRTTLPGLLQGMPAALPPVHPNTVVPSGAGDPTIVWKRATPPTGPVPPIPAPQAGAGGAAVQVAVIDTGVPDPTRTDASLNGLLHANRDNLDALDVFGAPGFLDLAAGHGAFVTGIIQRLAPAAHITVTRALDSDGFGTELGVATALLAAVRAGAQIVNLSLGVETYGDQPPLALEIALKLIAAGGNDVLIVAAAGNSGQSRRVWPAAFPAVKAVAALTQAGTAPWSSFGPWVDCSAVGEKVVSTYVTGTQDAAIATNPVNFTTPWARWTGTSFSAPRVVGLVAEIMRTKGLGPQVAFKNLIAGKILDPNYGALLQ
jgi:hypothetical protein